MGITPRGENSLLRQRSLRLAGVTVALALGLLLWARLKLVTGTPRMVYADPKAAASVDPPQDATAPARGEAPADNPAHGR